MRPHDGIEPVALDALLNYDWPGTVRELINIIERAMLIADTDTIGLADLPDELVWNDGPENRIHQVSSTGADADSRLQPEPWLTVRDRLLGDAERRYLHSLLGYTHGRLKDAAAPGRLLA